MLLQDPSANVPLVVIGFIHQSIVITLLLVAVQLPILKLKLAVALKPNNGLYNSIFIQKITGFRIYFRN